MGDPVVATKENTLIYEGEIQGSLHRGHAGFYAEQVITNRTNEKVVITDHTNKGVILPPLGITGNYNLLNGGDVEINVRSYIGAKTVSPSGHDATKSHHIRYTLNLADLNDKPIYVPHIDMVVSTLSFDGLFSHPNNRAYVQNKINDARTAGIKNAPELPIFISANDPTCAIKYLFCSINKHICCIKITHYKDEPSRIVVSYKDSKQTIGYGYNKIEVSFAELFNKSKDLWDIDGLWMSTNPDILKNHLLTQDVVNQQQWISIDEHNRQIDSLRLEHKKSLEIHQTFTQTLKDSNTRLEVLLKHYQDTNYSDHNAEIAVAELRAKQLKALADTSKIDNDRRSEVYNTVATVAKAAAVIVPVGFAIYRLVKQPDKPEK